MFLRLDYKEVKSTVTFDGYSVVVKPFDNNEHYGYMYERGDDGRQVTWSARSIYFRTEPEHYPPGVQADRLEMEVQIHHINSQGNIGILAFLYEYDSDAESYFFTQVEDVYDDYKDDRNDDDYDGSDLDLSDIATGWEYVRDYYTYTGTLTYQPCTTTKWFVAAEIYDMDDGQKSDFLEFMEEFMPDGYKIPNARPVYSQLAVDPEEPILTHYQSEHEDSARALIFAVFLVFSALV